MTVEFSRRYWDGHWQGTRDTGAPPAHPALESEIAGMTPGRALDAGSGEGAEAIWLAERGWRTTAVDISAEAVQRSATRARAVGADVDWVRADLTVWHPGREFALVTTFYAHPTMPQVAFFERISHWVAPGGYLLIVAHDEHRTPGGHDHPDGAVADIDAIRAILDSDAWDVLTAEVRLRTLVARHGGEIPLRDVVVRAQRRGPRRAD